MFISIIILLSTLFLLFFSQPLPKFSLLKWVVIAANIGMIILCTVEAIRSL